MKKKNTIYDSLLDLAQYIRVFDRKTIYKDNL